MIEKLLYTLYLFTWKRIKIKYICMIHRRDHYIFCDYHGKLWKLSPTHDYYAPFRIELVEQ